VDIKKVVATNIKAIRLIRKRTQEQVAWPAGLHEEYIGVVERSQKANLTLDAIAGIAKVLHVEPHELLIPDFWKRVK
jgi:transcriptional regulator with XRE-family HTH domain